MALAPLPETVMYLMIAIISQKLAPQSKTTAKSNIA